MPKNPVKEVSAELVQLVRIKTWIQTMTANPSTHNTHTHTNPTINGRPSKDARDHQETSWTRQKCFPHKQTGTDTDWEHVQARRMQRMDTEWSLGANQDCRHFGPGGKSQEHKESGWLGFAQTA